MPWLEGRLRRRVPRFLAAVFFAVAGVIPAKGGSLPFPATFAPVVEKVAPAVVTIINLGQASREALEDFEKLPEAQRFRLMAEGDAFELDGKLFVKLGWGSGAVVDGEGHIVTNHHVTARHWNSEGGVWEGGAHFMVLLGQSDAYVRAALLGSDAATDLAVLKVDQSTPQFLTLAKSDTVRVGDVVLALGTPRDLALKLSVSLGIVSGLGRSRGGNLLYEDFIQTDAAINPGNSGGPLVNVQGEVIGFNQSILLSQVVTSGATRANMGEISSVGNLGIGFAVPSDIARIVSEQIIKTGHVTRGFLGARLRSIPEAELRQKTGGAASHGVMVEEVLHGSPAEAASLRGGDIIGFYDRQPTASPARLRHLVALTRPDSEVTLSLMREGRWVEAKVKLGNLAESSFKTIGFEEPSEGRETGKDLIPGVTIDEAQVVIRGRSGMPQPTQVVGIFQVERDSEAWKAGLRPGQILSEVIGVPVSSIDEAVKARSFSSDKAVLLKVLDRDGPRQVTVPLP